MLDTRAASANAIEEAAKAIRHRVVATSAKRGGATKPARGRTTSADERSLAELGQRKRHKLGLERARVSAVATKAGQESDLRFEHIPVSQIDALTAGDRPLMRDWFIPHEQLRELPMGEHAVIARGWSEPREAGQPRQDVGDEPVHPW